MNDLTWLWAVTFVFQQFPPQIRLKTIIHSVETWVPTGLTLPTTIKISFGRKKYGWLVLEQPLKCSLKTYWWYNWNTGLQEGLVPIFTGHWVKGGVHLGQATRPLQRNIDTNRKNRKTKHVPTVTPKENIERTINFIMFFDFGRQPSTKREITFTAGEHVNYMQKDSRLGFEPRTLLI